MVKHEKDETKNINTKTLQKSKIKTEDQTSYEKTCGEGTFT